MLIREVQDRVASRGIDDTKIAYADDSSQVRSAPGIWTVVPSSERIAILGWGRGDFVPYSVVDTVDEAVRDIASLLGGVSQMFEDPGDLPHRGDTASRGIITRTQARGGRPGPNEIRVGQALDCLGPGTEHHAYSWGTPFPHRSQPPTDMRLDILQFVVLQPLPAAVHEGVAAPWFEQPGGGAMVVFDRPLRFYVDSGHLGLIPTPPEANPPSRSGCG